MTRHAARRITRIVVIGSRWCAGLAGVGVGVYLCSRRDGLPSPGSPTYEETVRRFYRGLASLQVGLLDDAKREFLRTTELAPREPAAWANLGLTHLRLGDFDPALQAIQQAASLAPSSSDIVFLLGQLESSRGRLDQAIADFRRAVELDPRNLRARFALAQEIERAAGQNADAEAQQLLEDLLSRRPENLPVLVERTRLAVKRGRRAVASGFGDPSGEITSTPGRRWRRNSSKTSSAQPTPRISPPPLRRLPACGTCSCGCHRFARVSPKSEPRPS